MVQKIETFELNQGNAIPIGGVISGTVLAPAASVGAVLSLLYAWQVEPGRTLTILPGDPLAMNLVKVGAGQAEDFCQFKFCKRESLYENEATIEGTGQYKSVKEFTNTDSRYSMTCQGVSWTVGEYGFVLLYVKNTVAIDAALSAISMQIRQTR